MASSIEDLSQKFDGFDAVMQRILDKVSGLDSWRVSADASMAELLLKADDNAARLQRLESAPPPRPPPPPPPPSAWMNPFDLNLAPGPSARPSASTGERPSGHRVEHGNRDAGGGILGSHPPHPVTGMAPTSHLRTHEFVPEVSAGSSRSSHKPKLEFPKFDGQQPRLWKDKCESYFEVYEISDALKPRFAALNFTGLAETWLHTAELRGRFMSWEALHTAVCARFDRDQYHLHLKQLDNLK